MAWARIAPPARNHRRVVVTGIGLVTPLGVGTSLTWSRLCAGESGVHGSVDGGGFGFPTARVPRGGGIGEWDTAVHVPRGEMRTMSPDFIAFAVGAAGEALRDAGLLPARARGAAALSDVANGAALGDDGRVGPYAAARVGVSLGTGIAAIEEIGSAAIALSLGQKLSPFFVPRILLNMPAGSVAMRFGLRGPNFSPSTACATGAHALGEAFRAVQSGVADAMLAGGTEASIGPIAIAGFSRARALAKCGEDATAASRPFDTKRSGFVLGEGAGTLVLECADAARARGARIYAEIRGFGASADAYHVTSPREDGSGAAACMRAALFDGGLVASDVGYVNAHATGTGVGDVAEATAIADVWGGKGGRVCVSSSKGNLGHLLGAAGAVEAAITVIALSQGLMPATRNLVEIDPLVDILCEARGGPLILLGSGGRGAAVPAPADDTLVAALSNSFGFGGTNASLLFAKFTTNN